MESKVAKKISGGCLCGAVSYEVENYFQQFYFCHCQQCRKITGSAFAANLFTHPDAIDWKSGQEYKKQFSYPQRDFSVVFCTECGSGLPFVTKSGKALVVPAGSLDTAPNIQPNDNIFWAERASWFEAGLTANKCDGFNH